MSDFRWDPLKRTWVIAANNRIRQQREYRIERHRTIMSACPFCPGHEGKTPPELFAFRPEGPANGPGWEVRVVPNKFPVLRIEGQLNRHPEGLYQTMAGVGAHEVVIETPDHDCDMSQIEVPQIALTLQAYRARLLDLRLDQRFRYLQVSKNHGLEAGAPIEHSHSQIMAVPVTPPVIKTELQACRDHYRLHCSCLICDLIQQELADGRRVILDENDLLVVAPYASCFPFELRIFPRRHLHDFALLTDTELLQFAKTLQNVLRRLHKLLEDPPYNFILHTAPPAHPRPDEPDCWTTLAADYHWHLELVPRLNRIAGFEWGSGFFINTMLPENAARFLRDTEPVIDFY